VLVYGHAERAGAGRGGLLLLVVFIVVEARFAARPLMPPRLLRIRSGGRGTRMLLCSRDRHRDVVLHLAVPAERSRLQRPSGRLGQTPAAGRSW